MQEQYRIVQRRKDLVLNGPLEALLLQTRPRRIRIVGRIIRRSTCADIVSCHRKTRKTSKGLRCALAEQTDVLRYGWQCHEGTEDMD